MGEKCEQRGEKDRLTLLLLLLLHRFLVFLTKRSSFVASRSTRQVLCQLFHFSILNLKNSNNPAAVEVLIRKKVIKGFLQYNKILLYNHDLVGT